MSHSQLDNDLGTYTIPVRVGGDVVPFQVIVRDRDTGAPVEDASVSVEPVGKGHLQ